MGTPGSKRKDIFMWRIGNAKQIIPRQSRKNLPRNSGIEKNLLRKTRSSKTIENWRTVYASREESRDCESVVDSDSGYLQNKVNSLTDARDFTILRQRAALEHPTFPASP